MSRYLISSMHGIFLLVPYSSAMQMYNHKKKPIKIKPTEKAYKSDLQITFIFIHTFQSFWRLVYIHSM